MFKFSELVSAVVIGGIRFENPDMNLVENYLWEKCK